MSTDTAPSSDPETAEEPVHVTDSSHLDQLVRDADVVLVDFYADWCGPCNMLEPVVADLAAETEAVVAKVDVDELPGLAAEYRVQGVPTMVLFADGEVVEHLVGFRDGHTLSALIEANTPA